MVKKQQTKKKRLKLRVKVLFKISLPVSVEYHVRPSAYLPTPREA